MRGKTEVLKEQSKPKCLNYKVCGKVGLIEWDWLNKNRSVRFLLVSHPPALARNFLSLLARQHRSIPSLRARPDRKIPENGFP